jgi:hypothetical protein
MPSFPNRCEHLKVNGTQCGSPALRRNRFCYFHKRHQDQLIALTIDQLRNGRTRRRKIAFELPVLEDANSIQISVMQIMRLLLSGQIDAKTSGLLLYALQIASANLSRTSFEPYKHDIILDPATVSETPLGANIWDDSDFDEDEEDEDEEENKKVAKPAAKSKPNSPAQAIPATKTPPAVAKRPPANVDLNEVRKQISNEIRQALPAIAAAQVNRDNGHRSG